MEFPNKDLSGNHTAASPEFLPLQNGPWKPCGGNVIKPESADFPGPNHLATAPRLGPCSDPVLRAPPAAPGRGECGQRSRMPALPFHSAATRPSGQAHVSAPVFPTEKYTGCPPPRDGGESGWEEGNQRPYMRTRGLVHETRAP